MAAIKSVPRHLAINPVAVSLWKLREEAIALGLQELAITFGWSLIRISEEKLRTTEEKLRKKMEGR